MERGLRQYYCILAGLAGRSSASHLQTDTQGMQEAAVVSMLNSLVT